jgi:PAS domain S-box-containing protein
MTRTIDDAPAGASGPQPENAVEILNKVIAWQKNVVEITNRLMEDEAVNLDQSINEALRQTGLMAGSDRTYVFRLRAPNRLDNTHEWVAEGIVPALDALQDLDDSIMAEWRADLTAGQSVSIPRICDLPETSYLKEILAAQGIKSLLVVPMRRDGVLKGFVGYDAVRSFRQFSDPEIELIQSVANTMNAVTERAAAEQTAAHATQLFQDESERLRATINAIPDLLIEMDASGTFVSVAPGAGIHLVFPFNDMVGKLPQDILTPDLVAVAERIMSDVDLLGGATNVEFPLMQPDGVHWLQANASPKSLDEKRGYLILIRDITVSRRQQERILQLSKIVELTSSLVIITDANYGITWCNPAFEQLSGWKLDEIIGKTPAIFIKQSKENNRNYKRVQKTLKKHDHVQVELLNVSKSGIEYWTQTDFTTVRDADGNISGLIAVQGDITDLKRSHKRAIHDRSVAIEESSDGIGVTQDDGGFTYMNPALEALFNIDRSNDVAGYSLKNFYLADTSEKLLEHLSSSSSSGGRWRGEVRADIGGRHSVIHELSMTKREDGGWVCVLHDVSERNFLEAERAKLREELQIAERRDAISELATGVAHDLNNLVAVVQGTAELIEQQVSENTEIRQGTNRIIGAMEMARNLVNNLSRLDRVEEARTKQDLETLLQQACDLLGARRIREHSVKTHVPSMPVSVWASVTDVLQVLTNLAVNACDAGPGGSNKVDLTIMANGSPLPNRRPDVGYTLAGCDYSLVIISDTGNGIDPENRAKLFERYFTTKGDNGTGLGLAIVATILRENHAMIWVDSSRGQGTQVTVAWPSHSPDRPVQSTHLTEDQPDTDTTLVGSRILVVDDEPDLAEIFSNMLRAVGATPVCVSNAKVAMKLLKDNSQDWSALLTDFDMPIHSGLDLAQVAKRRKVSLPVVLVTALPERAIQHHTFFASILPKPTTAKRLTATISKVVQNQTTQ